MKFLRPNFLSEPRASPAKPVSAKFVSALSFKRKTRGSIIVLVLVTVLLAAFLLSRFVERSGTEMLADAKASNQSRMRREAYSSLEVTLAVITEFRNIDNGLYSPAQGWDRPLDYANYTPADGRTVEVAFEDESGKISLPKADLARLESLLAALKVDPQTAENVSDAILAWTKADYTPISQEVGDNAYQKGELPHHPAQRPLRSFSELAAIKYAHELFFDANGTLNQIGRGFVDSLSLYSFDKTNINGTTGAVLAAGGLDSSQIDGLNDYSSKKKGDGSQSFFRSVSEASTIVGANASMQTFGADIKALRVIVTVHDGAAIYRIGAVVAPPGGATLAPTPTPAADPSNSGGNISPAKASTPETEPLVIKKLDYPFKVLEITEDLETTPPPPADSPRA